MAKSSVKRKRVIQSYAGFTTGAAKYTIEPMTRAAHQYALEFLRRRTVRRTGNLEDNIVWDVRGTAGAVKAVSRGNVGGGASHAHLIEYGTGPRHQKNGRYTGAVAPRPFMRPGARKALREMRRHWEAGLEAARREQSA